MLCGDERFLQSIILWSEKDIVSLLLYIFIFILISNLYFVMQKIDKYMGIYILPKILIYVH